MFFVFQFWLNILYVSDAIVAMDANIWIDYLFSCRRT